ncbi:MAG: hypothetical protein SGCHY_005173 [Lobulomycetales sp.]
MADFQAFLDLNQQSPWQLASTKQGVEIFRAVSEHRIHLFKGRKLVHQPISRVFDSVKGVDVALKVDKMMTRAEILDSIDEDSDLIYMRYKVGFPITDRDFICTEHRTTHRFTSPSGTGTPPPTHTDTTETEQRIVLVRSVANEMMSDDPTATSALRRLDPDLERTM